MNIEALKCLLDLHVHLDGSLSVHTIKRLAQMQNISISMTDEQLLDKLQVPAGCQDLNEYLARFDYPLQFLQTKTALTESVRCLLYTQKEQGIIYSEIRFAPQLHQKKGLSQQEVVEAAIKALHSTSGIDSGLILCCMRGKNNQESNIETIRTAAYFLGKGVVAVDLAGAEGLFPTREFQNLFLLARKLHIPFTIHAGEAAGADSVKCAVEYGASRIGHGIRCLEDPEVCRLIRDRNIPLELCPTSNLNTKVFSDITKYPIMELLNAGIKITINTDNMMVSNTTIKQELNLIQQTFQLSDEHIRQILLNAVDAAFTTHSKQMDLKKRINNEFTKY